MNKLNKDFYLRRIKYLEDECNKKDNDYDILNNYIDIIRDNIDDVITLINEKIKDEQYNNLTDSEKLLYRVKEILKGEDKE